MLFERMRRKAVNEGRSQSAMEFLMTYGWSVLIVTAVLVILFNMGVFNSSTYAPKAQPGNCKVLRTGGFTNLEGTCSGIPPQSVAMFNGGSSYIIAGNGAGLNPTSAITVAVWVKMANIDYTGMSGNLLTFASKGSPDCGSYTAGWWFSYDNRNNGHTFDYTTFGNSNQIGCSGGGNNFGAYSYTFTNGAWYDIVMTANQVAAKLYINGAEVGGAQPLTNTLLADTGNNLLLGQSKGAGYLFNGLMSNLQIYNTSLDASQIQLLYIEGIGGAPIAPQNIVGWWPLNGNANDYSGNNNNGAPTNIVYTGSWTSGYTAP
jgi:hypothetical protein